VRQRHLGLIARGSPCGRGSMRPRPARAFVDAASNQQRDALRYAPGVLLYAIWKRFEKWLGSRKPLRHAISAIERSSKRRSPSMRAARSSLILTSSRLYVVLCDDRIL